MKVQATVLDQDVKAEIEKEITVFNASKLANGMIYTAEYKNKFIYLLRLDFEGVDFLPICRLTYNGDLKNMDFAIYKYSSEKYDANEMFFPGAECVDGTVTGALKAGMKGY